MVKFVDLRKHLIPFIPITVLDAGKHQVYYVDCMDVWRRFALYP